MAQDERTIPVAALGANCRRWALLAGLVAAGCVDVDAEDWRRLMPVTPAAYTTATVDARHASSPETERIEDPSPVEPVCEASPPTVDGRAGPVVASGPGESPTATVGAAGRMPARSIADPSAAAGPEPSPREPAPPEMESSTPVTGAPEVHSVAEERAGGPEPILDGLEVERRLRRDFAAADQPVAEVAALAAFLALHERHGEALAAVELAMERCDDVRIACLRATLLRDLARCRDAVVQLEAVCERCGGELVPPASLLELAELHWVMADRESACRTLAQLQQSRAAADFCTAHAADIRALADEIGRFATPQTVRGRDLLAHLRGAPTATLRLSMLDQVLSPAGAAGEARDELRAAALRVALRDRSAAIRTRALQHVEPDPEEAAGFWAQMLADEAALVRREAVRRAALQLGADAAGLMLACLESEADPAVRTTIAAQLVQWMPPELQPADSDGGTLAHVVAYWRQLCRR